MTDCIFCKIIAGEIPCAKVYEDDHTLAFLDIAPTNKGHTLVVSKKHYETLFDAPVDVMQQVIATVKSVSAAVKKGTQCDGICLGMNNYPAAGQLVPHIHLHIIPRLKDDGLHHWPQQKYAEGEMDVIREKIAKEL